MLWTSLNFIFILNYIVFVPYSFSPYPSMAILNPRFFNETVLEISQCWCIIKPSGFRWKWEGLQTLGWHMQREPSGALVSYRICYCTRLKRARGSSSLSSRLFACRRSLWFPAIVKNRSTTSSADVWVLFVAVYWIRVKENMFSTGDTETEGAEDVGRMQY